MAIAETATAPAATEKRAQASAKARTQKIRIEQHSSIGLLWFGGWLFTIGLLHLPLGKALLGLIVWPYYLGASLSGIAG